MNNVRGMTLKQLNDVLDEMHSIYPFKPETTRLGDFRDINTGASRQVEIVTKDESTGIDIVLAKGVSFVGEMLDEYK